MDTPNTMNFMIAGYAVIFAAMALYVVTLLVRFRNLRQDEIMLNQMDETPEE
mgnify:CR=1 FL=1